jgi:protein-S-isoprenylcysteine O-methyltransferase Ste14
MNVETSVGVAFAAISFGLVILARLQLGKSFTVTPRASSLVTHGLYSRLRHPMYIFFDVSVCGIALALHRWYVLSLLAILLPLQMKNARKAQDAPGEVRRTLRDLSSCYMVLRHGHLIATPNRTLATYVQKLSLSASELIHLAGPHWATL